MVKKEELLKNPKRIRTIDGEKIRLRGYYSLVTTDGLRAMREGAIKKDKRWEKKTLKQYLAIIGALE